MIRIGLVDFDTSHVVAFTQRINHVDIAQSEWVDGAKIVAGCPGRSFMMPERIPGYEKQLRGYGIDLVDSPEELIPLVDAVMIESQQGAVHLDRARPFLTAGLPTFVDKPFTATTEQADEIIALARKHGAIVISWSPLRFDPAVQEALSLEKEYGKLLSVDVWSTATLHPGNPGLLHYGIHGVEMLYALMGPGCLEVRTLSNDRGEVTTGLWPGGRIGTMRGLRAEQSGVGFIAHYEHGCHYASIQTDRFYKTSLDKIVSAFETVSAPINISEAREIIAYINAAMRSGDADGRAERLD